jgi:predicted anti-sigma-YlaC factor YlaD
MSNGVEQLSCQEVVELVTDYLEGVLPDNERGRFEEHLRGCDGCRQYIEQMRTTIRLAGESSPRDMSTEAERSLLGAFRNWKSG